MMITVQSATPAMFEDVHQLLLGFESPKLVDGLYSEPMGLRQ
jgi:hypothetical protein